MVSSLLLSLALLSLALLSLLSSLALLSLLLLLSLSSSSDSGATQLEEIYQLGILSFGLLFLSILSAKR